MDDDRGFVALVPARMASTRLPDKPLADIGGEPMVLRVARQAQASGARLVAVATDSQRVAYYDATCRSLGLNPLTKPFEFLRLNGKLIMYARRDCSEQLRAIRGVSIAIVAREVVEDCYIVTARATDKAGRSDESIGAVPIAGLKGEARANAMMKAETKAKRRVTLSVCGLGMSDESEVESIPGAQRVPVDVVTVESQPAPEPPAPADPQQAKRIKSLLAQLGWAKPHAANWFKKHFGVASFAAITADQVDAICAALNAEIDDATKAAAATAQRATEAVSQVFEDAQPVVDAEVTP
jgi:hypothetical protein